MTAESIISVIVPVYKTEKYIRQCVDSLLSQTYPHIEVILVDDGSPDACPAICDEYARIDSRVKTIHQSNAGLSAARNTGIQNAAGAYVFFLDSDDYLESDAIEMLAEKAGSLDCDLCFCDAKSFFDSKDDAGLKMPAYIRKKDYGHTSGVCMVNRLIRGNDYKTSSALLLIKKDLLIANHIEFYRGILHEDNLFTLRVFLASESCAHVYKCLYKRRIHSDSITTRKFNARNFHGYVVCISELSGDYKKETDPEKRKVLSYFIESLCGAMNEKYGSFDKELKKQTHEDNAAMQKLCQELAYFHDIKFRISMRFGALVRIYRKIRKNLKSS